MRARGQASVRLLDAGRCQRIGLLGGTFNPIHAGHLIVAEETLEALHLDKVVFIPCFLPPHKDDRTVASARHRLQMVRLAVKGNPRFTFSDLEISRKGKSYTVETLKTFRRLCGETAEIFFLMGVDQILDIATWKHPEEVFRLANVVVLTRPGYDLRRLSGKWRKKICPVQVSPIGISSTEIRKRLKAGRSIRYLATEGVRRYIVRHKLYRRKDGDRRD